MKYLLSLLALLFAGCEINAPTDEYKAFVKNHNGAQSYYYCDTATGFLMQEMMVFQDGTTSTLSVVPNDSDTPIRCTNNVSVQVNESVATGLFAGDVK